MNRLSPLIVRKTGRHAVAVAWPASTVEAGEVTSWLEDVRLFLVGWIGGLIFFGTLLS